MSVGAGFAPIGFDRRHQSRQPSLAERSEAEAMYAAGLDTAAIAAALWLAEAIIYSIVFGRGLQHRRQAA